MTETKQGKKRVNSLDFSSIKLDSKLIYKACAKLPAKWQFNKEILLVVVKTKHMPHGLSSYATD